MGPLPIFTPRRARLIRLRAGREPLTHRPFDAVMTISRRTRPRRLERISFGAERITQARHVPVHCLLEVAATVFNAREWRSLRQADQVAVWAGETAVCSASR